MKSIGETVKEARTSKRLSRQDLEKETKIKASFIKQIEAGSWDNLPDYPVVSGFVKKIAKALDFDENHAIALLRRDYPPKSLTINPKPDADTKFSWSPKLTFILGVVVVVLAIFVYLVFQYLHFIRPPVLLVNTPQDEQVVYETILKVSGETDPDASLKVNNQPVIITEDGSFETEIEIFEGTEEVLVVARSRSGKEAKVIKKIEVQLE